MFETLTPAKPDAILGLNDAFRNDSNPNKINLSVGVFQDDTGRTPALECVVEASKRLAADSSWSPSYLPIQGMASYGTAVRNLLFGGESEIVQSGRAATVQTPGGTGALRVAADFLHEASTNSKLWVSSPTWANHTNIFSAAGVPVESYPYYDKSTHGFAAEEMLGVLKQANENDIVLLHACCHNPTGVDPTAEQWKAIGDCIEEGKLIPLLDFAYQGFGAGIEEDAAAIREICRPGIDALICSSFSKNFSLYNERVGALTLVAQTTEQANIALGRAKSRVRSNYSNPPAHGARLVNEVLNDEALRTQWESEVAAMRNRILSMRTRFVEEMKTAAPDHDFSHISRQNGMFSYSGLTPIQVDELRNKHSIYIVGSGRINVAGMQESTMSHLCQAIASVL